MEDNALAAEIARRTAKWESMLEPTHKKDKTLCDQAVWAAESVQRFALEVY